MHYSSVVFCAQKIFRILPVFGAVALLSLPSGAFAQDASPNISTGEDDFVYKTSDALSKELFEATQTVADRAAAVASNKLEQGQTGAVMSTPPLPVPNLAIDVTLNSALNEELTRYYSEIAQEILNSLPRRVTLTGDQASLLSGSRKYDKLNVIAYLPNPDKGPDADPMAKDIRHFEVEFEVPDMLMEAHVQQAKERGEEPKRLLVVHTGRSDDFMNDPSVKTSVSAPVTKLSDKLRTDGVSLTDDGRLVVASRKVVAQKAKELTVQKVVLKQTFSYQSDFAAPDEGLESFVSKAKNVSGLSAIHYVGSVKDPLIGDAGAVFKARMSRVSNALEDAGVDVSSVKQSAIILKAIGDSDQRIRVDFISEHAKIDGE